MAMSGANPVNFTQQTPPTGQARGPAAQPGGHNYGVDGLAGSVPPPPTSMGQVGQTGAPAAPKPFPSGLQLLKDQGGVAFQALLPAGPFLPVQVAVQRALDGTVQAQMFNPGNPQQPIGLNAQMGRDGKVYMQVEQNNPTLLVLDPEKAEFGVTSPFQNNGAALVREHSQMVAADGTKISRFHETTTAEGKQFTEIYENPRGQVWGFNVHEAPDHGQAQQGGFMRDLGRTFGIGGPNSRQEDPLKVTGNSQQGYDVKGGSLWGHASASSRNGFNGFFDWRNAPVQKWLRGRQQEVIHLAPFSAAGAGAIFPSIAQLARSAPPAPPQAGAPGAPPAQPQAAPWAPPTPPQAPPSAPPSSPAPGPASGPSNQLLMQLQEALQRNDLAAAQAIMAQINGQPAGPAQQAAPAQPAPPPASGPPQVSVMLGDITRVPVDTLITGVNSEGMWMGGVDGAIQRAGGGQFHEQAAHSLIGARSGDGVFARTQQQHQGAFQNVAFVVDDLDKPLYDVLSSGLDMADRNGSKSVAIPAMRLGVLKNAGGTEDEKIADMARAVRDFQARAQNVKDIKFVIYGDEPVARKLQSALQEPAAQPAPAAAQPQAAQPSQAPPQPQELSFQGVGVTAVVGGLLQGAADAQSFFSSVEAEAEKGNPEAIRFANDVNRRVAEVQQEMLQAAEKTVATATPEQLGTARAALAKVAGGDQSEFNAKVKAAQGGDGEAVKWVELVQSVALVDGAAAGRAAAEAEAAKGGAG